MKNAIAALLILVAAIAGRASVVGEWYTYPSYANPPQKVIETDKMVYFTSGGNLFSFDKKNGESYSYTIQNKLTDSGITGIYYNHDRNYLVVCYSSGNIDLLYDDGRMKNISDIVDSSVPAPLTINNVCFDGDNFYAATSFGVVKFNEPRAEVVTSGNYGKNVNSVAIMGNWLIIHTDGCFFRIDKSSILSVFDRFSKMYDSWAPVEMWADTDESFVMFANQETGMLARHVISNETGKMKSRKVISAKHTSRPSYISCAANGSRFYVADGNLYTLQPDGDDFSEVLLTALPEEFSMGVAGTCKGRESVWSLTREGLGHYAFDGMGGQTTMMERYTPEGISLSHARYFYPSKDEKRLYVQNSGVTNYRFGGASRGLENVQAATCIDLSTGEYEDATAYPVHAEVGLIQGYQKQKGLYAIAPVSIAEDPTDPQLRFIATSDDGIYKVRGTTVEGRYGHLNSPITYIDNRDVVYGCSFDNFGNLWVMKYSDAKEYSPLCILPAAKVKLPTDQITKADWFYPNFSDVAYFGGQDIRFLHCKKSNLVFILSSGGRIFVWDHRGTGSDFSDDRYLYIGTKITDQDGNEFSSRYKAGICEDLNGTVWIGTESGIIEMNPSKVFNPGQTFVRVKMPRNDGTNLADYTLGTDFSVDISVDAANRKWVATTTSGVFCLTPSGDQIVENFTAENSELPTNYINAIYADRNTGTIYIGTDYGLMTYAGGASAPKENYNDILVYPNPVRPEHHGSVTITGLMDNSLVKITDSAGNVIHQGRSEAGRYQWNACNSMGARVPAGVYFVMASQNASGSSSGAVAKIMVIN